MNMRFKNSGFTMMEILVAMVLMAIVGANSLSAISSSTRIVQSNDNTAGNVARSYLEQFYEYVRQDHYAAATPSPLSMPPAPPALTQTLGGVTYTTAYTVASVDVDGGGEDYRRVNMTVSW